MNIQASGLTFGRFPERLASGIFRSFGHAFRKRVGEREAIEDGSVIIWMPTKEKQEPAKSDGPSQTKGLDAKRIMARSKRLYLHGPPVN